VFKYLELSKIEVVVTTATCGYAVINLSALDFFLFSYSKEW